MNKPGKDAIGRGGKVIEFKAYPRPGGLRAPSEAASGAVVDMIERRNDMLSQERRTVKRTILSEFIGAFVVIPTKGLQRVALYDISESGLSFDLGMENGAFNAGEEIAMRVYINQHTYFPFIVQIHNASAE